MAYNQLFTKNGHYLSDMSNMLQKSIRRCNPDLAGYAANEMFGRYHAYLWRRLITISAEDCYGDITKEIIALKEADDIVNKNRKGYDKDKLFVAKAVTLLLFCRKNRDGCFFACNKMLSEKVIKNCEDVLNLDECVYDGYLPDYCKDFYSRFRRSNPKATSENFIADEERAIEESGHYQEGVYDHADWSPALDAERQKGGFDNDTVVPKPTADDLKRLESYDEEQEQISLFGN